MQATQTEIVDRLTTDQREGTIVTGSYYTVTSSAVIRSVHIENPKRGPNTNPSTTFIRFSMDNKVKWSTLGRGDRMSINARPVADRIDMYTNASSAKFEMILLVEDTGGE